MKAQNSGKLFSIKTHNLTGAEWRAVKKFLSTLTLADVKAISGKDIFSGKQRDGFVDLGPKDPVVRIQRVRKNAKRAA
jgi:hypothetical protein